MSAEVARSGEYRAEVFPHGPVAKKVDPWKRPPTSLERMDAIQEHGTHRGYEAGCRGSHCPGVDLVGMSCAQAKIRYQGDMSYRRRVDGGLSAEAIWAEDQLDGVKPPRVTIGDPRGAGVWEDVQVTVADSVEDFDDEDAPGIDTAAMASLPAPQAAPVPSEPASASGGRTAKWAVRRVWVAVSPDGVLHGPHESREAAFAVVEAALRPKKSKPHRTAAQIAKPKRVRRPWTDEESETLLRLHGEGMTGAAIAKEMGRLASVILQRQRMAGLPTNGKRVDA